MITNLVEKMIFYPERNFLIQPEYFRLTYQDVFIRTEDKLTIHGWFFPASGLHTVLFLHGNAGNIADRLDNVHRLVRRNIAVLIIDYRGYGKSEGSPSEKGTYLDARAAWNWLTEQSTVDMNKVVIFGRSLGGAVAIELATCHQPYRLIIESSFTSVKELGNQLIPIVPQALIPNIYPSIERINRIQCPVLIIHGTKDTLIPFPHGKKLFDEAKEPKKFYAVENGDHNDTYVVGGEVYFDTFTAFIHTE